MARRPCSALLLVALVALSTPARAVITDTGSIEVSPDGRLVIGASAFGSRVVDGEDDGPYVSAELGLESGGQAELSLANGARLRTTEEIFAGGRGSVVIEVSEGSRLLTGGASVAKAEVNTYNLDPYRIIVTDPGSRWVNSGLLDVGNLQLYANVQIIVRDGGEISTDGARLSGNWADIGNMDLIIEGEGTSWQNSGFLALNPTSEVIIRGGAIASDNGVAIGGSYYNNRALVEGQDSLWRTQQLIIGSRAEPLVVRNGARVESTSVMMTTQTSQRVVIQGEASEWVVSGELGVFTNAAGGNSFVTIEDGAFLDTGSVHVGDGGAGYAGVEIAGPGSRWRNADSMLVRGSNATAAELKMLEGARARTVTLGIECNATRGLLGGCGVVIDGSDSILEVQESATMTTIAGTEHDSASWLISNGGRTEVGGLFEAIGTSRIELDQGSLAANQLLLTGATLTGSGLVEAEVVNRGDVAPGQRIGAIEIVGDYHQETDGTLSIELDGRIAGEEHDFLSVLSTSFLGGRLAVALGDGFLPQVGDVFHVLESTAIAGEFDSFQGLQLTPTRRLAVEYLPTGVQLVTVSEPGTGMLLAAGVSLLAGIRRRSAGPRP